MGKKKATSAYVHAHTHNPSARESDDRRAAKLATMEVTRLERALDRQQTKMRSYLPESELAKKKAKIGMPTFSTICFSISYPCSYLLLSIHRSRL
jgi:hypothetical protein